MSENLAIFHGYRLPAGVGVMDLADTLRNVFLPIRDELEIRDIAIQASRILSAADVAGTPRPGAVMFDAVQAHSQHIAEILAGEHENCPLPVASMTVADDPDTGVLYALLHAQHPEYNRAMDDHGIADYFPYWDAAADLPDRPLGISADNWKERRDIWTRVLRGTSAENPDGLFQIPLGRALPDMDVITRAGEVLAAIPGVQARTEHALAVFAREQDLSSFGEQLAFAASVPEHFERIRSALKPITIADLSGDAS